MIGHAARLPLALAAIGHHLQASHQKQVNDFKRAILQIQGSQAALGSVGEHFGMRHGEFLPVTQPKIERDKWASGVNLVQRFGSHSWSNYITSHQDLLQLID